MYTQIIAHRGASTIAPENTPPAFEQALQLSIDGVELEVPLSADAHPVGIHERLFERTTSGKDPVEKLTLTKLRTLDAGEHFSDAF